jgi:hypothetical protein
MVMSPVGLGNKNHCAGEKQQQLADNRDPRVEAGTNISTIALSVAEGDEKGTQCLGV